jgi:hypothetical protein
MLLGAAVLGGLGCSGSTPRDIHYGTDAEANFEAPVFEAKPKDASDDGGTDDASDASDAPDAAAAGTGGAGAGGSAGSGGEAGSDAAVGDAGQ